MKRIAFLALTCVLVFAEAKPCEAQRAAGSVTFAWPASTQIVSASDSLPVHSLTPRDTFLGPDKVKHFFMSAFLESVGFSGMQIAGANRSVSLGAAVTVTAAAGVARELHDKRTKGLFSFGDLTWDALGIGAAALLLSHTQR